MERTRPKAPWFCMAIFVLTLGLLYLPMLYLMAGSLVEKTSEGLQLTFRWYMDVFGDAVLQEALVRSLMIATGNAVVSTLLGATASLALFRSQFRYKKNLKLLALISLVMPELVFALSLLSWFFLLKLDLGWLTVMISHVSFTLSFVMFILNSRLSTLNFSLDEVAQDLSASPQQILWKVTLPLMKPALGLAFILAFLLSFDDFLVTFYTGGVGMDTLPIKLYSAMRLGHSPKLNALSTLMILFSLILIAFLFHSKAFRDLWEKRNEKVNH